MTMIATEDDMLPVQASSLGTGLIWGTLVLVSAANLLHEAFAFVVPGLTDAEVCMGIAGVASVVTALASASRQKEAVVAGLFLMLISMI